MPWFDSTDGTVSDARTSLQLGADHTFSVTGAVLIALGAAILVIGLRRATNARVPRWFPTAVIVLGAAAGLVTLYAVFVQMPGISTTIRDVSPLVTTSTGIGAWVALAGSIVSVIGGVLLLTSARATASS